jgi:Ser/Thr protein kinase RdoA (MazF antagonist)
LGITCEEVGIVTHTGESREQAIRDVVRIYAVDRTSIIPLASSDELFRCRLGDRSCVLRLSRYKSFAEQKAEAEWVNYLSDNGVAVARVIPSAKGNLAETIGAGAAERTAVLFEEVPGHHPTTEEWETGLWERCGRLIGRMHALAKSYNRESAMAVRDWVEQEEYDWHTHIPTEQTRVREKCNELYTAIERLPTTGDAYGITHSDVFQDNLKIHKGTLTLLDFQDCERHFFVNDLAVLIYFALEMPHRFKSYESYASAVAASLLRGYRQENELDPIWIERIPLFLKLREILSYTICYCYWDMGNLADNQRTLLSLYRKNIEHNIPVAAIDFSSLG